MSSSEIENLSAFDHSFKAIHDEEVPWEDGLDNNLLTLPPGIQVKVFAQDEAMKRVCLLYTSDAADE